MWRVKSCPRCGGDLYIDRDMDSWYEQCLMCAYRNELREISKLKQEPVQVSKKAVDEDESVN